MVLVIRESGPQRSLDSGTFGHSEGRGLLSLERKVPGGHEADLSGEDGE